MKKVYLLGVVLSLGLSAVAAPNEAVKQAKYSAEPATAEMIKSEFLVGDGIAINTPAMATAPAKAVSSTDELLGLKKWSGIRIFKNPEYNGPQEGKSFAADPRPTRITLNEFPESSLNMRVEIDLAKKEAYINNESFIGTVQAKDNNGNTVQYEVNIYTYKNNGDIVYDTESNLYKYSAQPEECEQAVGKILDDGTISFDGYTLAASSPGLVEEGSYWIMLYTANLVIESTLFNTPNEAEYNYVGKGEFKDPYFAPMFNDPSIVPVNKDVDVYVKGDEDGILIGVKNPYKKVPGEPVVEDGQTYEITDFWKDYGVMYEEASEDGWLLFKVFNGNDFDDYPYAAAQLQLVPCGMEMDNSEDRDGSNVEMFYPFNNEGAAYENAGVKGVLDEIEGIIMAKGDWSRVKDNTLYIYNAWFGFGSFPSSGYWWQTKEGTSADRIEGYVTLPEGWLEAGVNSVISDNENAPVKYYNLQGIELKTPVKGQLTIRKQGNKSTKFIAR